MPEAGAKAPRHGGTKGKRAKTAARRLGRAFYSADPIALAQSLLGQRLVRILDDGTRLAGLIVETEAYLGIEDRAAHSFGGRRTERVRSMYQQPGTAYVYFTYGMHYCFNVVCGAVDEPVAVLIRALEPVEGLDFMRANRGARPKAKRPGSAPTPARAESAHRRAPPGLPILPDRELCSGPAKLCQALAIDRRLDGVDLVRDHRFFIERARRADLERGSLGNGPRIGVAYARDWARKELRWFIRGNPNVSRQA